MREYVTSHRMTDPQLESWRSLTDIQLAEQFDIESRVRRDSVSNFFVNCWHMNEHESSAMWRLYSQSDEAICVQSTFNRLTDVVPKYVNIGMVQYLNYETEMIPTGNTFNFILAKRKSFDHEQELRAVAWQMLSAESGGDEIRQKMSDTGLAIEVDLSRLIETVYVSPLCPSWFTDVVQQLLKMQNLAVRVIQSSLSESPVY